MDFFDLIERRQSVRKYQPKGVESATLKRILDAANRAPSAGNFQSYEIYVVQAEKQRKALGTATFEQELIAQAPLLLVFGMNPSRCEYAPPEAFAMEDASIACTFAMLAATALGLVTCWVGAFDAEKTAALVHCRRGVTPIAILAIGYPAEVPERTPRRAMEDLVHFVE